MDSLTTHPILTIILAVLGGGTGTVLLSRLFMSKKDAADVATGLYTALAGQVTALQGHVNVLQTTIDEWKTKYYQLLDECATLKLENQQQVAQIADLMHECGDLKQENLHLRAEVNLIRPKPAFFNSTTPTAS